ncbi:hypothetical protein PFISCL1PPCAC_232, partial [Pristionchus fissidentatus]
LLNMHLSFFLLCFVATFAASYDVTLYTDVDWKGDTYDIEDDECYNIPHKYLKKDDGVSGIWTKGTCVYVYDRRDCKGSWIMMHSRSPHHGNLGKLGFNDRAMSIGPC